MAKIRVLNGEDEFLSSLDIEATWLFPSKDIKDISYELMDNEPYTKFSLKDLGNFRVYGFGYHIALDASLAILGALKLGKSVDEVRENLLNYKGIKKRFDIIQNYRDSVVLMIMDTHPTEIKATIEALKIYKELKEGL